MRKLLVNSLWFIVYGFRRNLLIFFIFLYTIYNILLTLPPTVYAQMATSRDWIGLFPQGAEDGPSTNPKKSPPLIDWKYVNCAKNPTDPVNWGECNFTMPDKVGNYEFRLYANDSNVRVGSSNPFYVTLDSGSGGSLCQVNRQATGLISTSQEIEGTFGNLVGTCITNPQAAYVPFKIPNFEEIKTVFYNQARSTVGVQKIDIYNDANQSNIKFNGSTDYLVNISGKLKIDGPVIGNKTGVVFVEDSLQIDSNINYGSGTSGLVFVVKGNIDIAPTVTKIDAVLISEGTICTATPTSGDCSGVVEPGTTKQLVINGNLIALSQTNPTPIRFRRNLDDNSLAAEVVNHESKYFVILKNLFSQTLTITTELN